MPAATLPTELPRWYGLKDNEEKGWTPETTDITDNPANRDVTYAWDGAISPQPGTAFTVRLDKLRIFSPIQVGGAVSRKGVSSPPRLAVCPAFPVPVCGGRCCTGCGVASMGSRTKKELFGKGC